MSKLIARYRKLPTPTNRRKLEAYLDKHIMAIVTATPDEIHFLREHGFIN